MLKLPIAIDGGKNYLYRPSVDCLMRQFYEHGLSGFLLNQRIQKCDEMRLKMQVNGDEATKAMVRKRIVDAAEHIWTYVAYVSTHADHTMEAKMEAFTKLCEQVDMPSMELNSMLQSR